MATSLDSNQTGASARPATPWPARVTPDALNAALDGASAQDVLRTVLQDAFPGRVAVVSSFGAEAAVLLDLVARVDPAAPVIFLETGKHFPETLAYRDLLIRRLRLTGVRSVRPTPQALERIDPQGTLWSANSDACCDLRKVRPLEQALSGFDAWISGRKRYQSGLRQALPVFERDAGRVKVNPLADWTSEQIDAYYLSYGLPRHPLFDQGYPSIGCAPCTSPAAPGEDARAGRWRHAAKTECGIHRTTWDVGL